MVVDLCRSCLWLIDQSQIYLPANNYSGHNLKTKYFRQSLKETHMFNKILATMLLVVASTLPSVAVANQYPDKPIRVIVPWPVGGATDVVVRTTMTKLSSELGQPIVIDNRIGGSGVIGTGIAARSPSDGYTLLANTSSTHAITPNLIRTLPYNSINDFKPITMIATGPTVLVAPANAPFNTVAELVALAKSKPGVLNYASYGNNTSPHLTAVWFEQVSGTTATQIPYKGTAPAVTALMAGEVDFGFIAIPALLQHLEGGRLKAIATTGATRSGALPNVPPGAETYPNFEVAIWYGLDAPANTPDLMINKLNQAMKKVLADPEVIERFRKEGTVPAYMTPDQARKFILKEKNKWARVIKAANIPVSD